MQTTSTVLMIKPVNFGFNEETSESNAFQVRSQAQQNVHKKALKEFNEFVDLLKLNGVEVIVIEDTLLPAKPDSIFPNNWFSSHDDGSIFLYPMQAKNRRLERRSEIIEALQEKFKSKKTVDLSYFEKEEKFLEGTGSMVLDRPNKIAYACLSPGTDEEVLNEFSKIAGYKLITFHSTDLHGKAIYHTNVMMCLGEKFSVVCLDIVSDELEKKELINSLTATNKEIVTISYKQLKHFAGNMLQLKNVKNEDLLVMSKQAFDSLTDNQLATLRKHCRIIFSTLDTIETTGGGSARCMIAEIHLGHK